MEKRENSYSERRKKGLFRRLFSPVKMISEVFIEGALTEISKALKDYLTGAVSFVFALFFFFFFWLSLNALIAVGIHRFAGLDYFLALLIVAAINLLFSCLFFMIAKRKFNRDK